MIHKVNSVRLKVRFKGDYKRDGSKLREQEKDQNRVRSKCDTAKNPIVWLKESITNPEKKASKEHSYSYA